VASITVLVAARRPETRAVCRRVLGRGRDVRLVGLAASAFEVLGRVLTLKPRVVVLEASLWPRAIEPLVALLHDRAPETRVLIVGARVPSVRVVDALAHGAHGHLERDHLGARLAHAVRAVAAGEAWISRRLVPSVLSRLSSPSPRPPSRTQSIDGGVLAPGPTGRGAWRGNRRSRQ
jgi:DNA-binding NarL/FixJ family response regulator